MVVIVSPDAEKLKRDSSRGSDAITASLRKAIQSGIYADNEKLPPERELAEAFGAARGTVRRALDQLENMELVVRRVGSGTFVKYAGKFQHASGEVAENTSPLQLIETRFSIEPYMTKLACVHATRLDISSIGDVLLRLEESEDNISKYTELDSEFHMLIARCSRNPLIFHLYQQVNEVRRHSQWEGMQKKILTRENIREYDRQHRLIYKAIEGRDVYAAVARITEHLEKARLDLVGAESR